MLEGRNLFFRTENCRVSNVSILHRQHAPKLQQKPVLRVSTSNNLSRVDDRRIEVIAAACFAKPKPHPAQLHSNQPPLNGRLSTYAAARTFTPCQHTHIWKLAGITTVCAWSFRNKTGNKHRKKHKKHRKCRDKKVIRSCAPWGDQNSYSQIGLVLQGRDFIGQ